MLLGWKKIIIYNSKHFPHREKPKLVIDYIEDFMGNHDTIHFIDDSIINLEPVNNRTCWKTYLLERENSVFLTDTLKNIQINNNDNVYI